MSEGPKPTQKMKTSSGQIPHLGAPKPGGTGKIPLQPPTARMKGTKRAQAEVVSSSDDDDQSELRARVAPPPTAVMGLSLKWKIVIAMAAGLFIIGCFGPLISIYVRDTLGASAGLFGYVSGMVGIGLLVGTMGIREIVKRAKASDTGLVLSGLAGIGAGVLLLGAVPHIVATFAATFTIGFAFGAIIVPASTLIQRETPPDMLGRVGSTNASLIVLGQILGLAVSGVLAELVGVRTVFFMCAALSVALALAGRLFLQSTRS